jgi:hypothetical protein
MKSFKTALILSISLLNPVVSAVEKENWISKHVSTPIEYTVFNEVSIVHNTKLSFDEFWGDL